MSLSWKKVKPLLKGLDYHQPTLDFYSPLKTLEDLISDQLMGEVFISGMGKDKKSLAQHIFDTGNIDAVTILLQYTDTLQTRHTHPNAIGYDSFPFPFPARHWSDEQAVAGLNAWKSLFEDRYTDFLPRIAVDAKNTQNEPALTWSVQEGLWENTPEENAKTLRMMMASTTHESFHAPVIPIFEQGLDTLKDCPNEVRMNTTYSGYAIGVIKWGYTKCPLHRDNMQTLKIDSAHQKFAFQHALGSWEKWALWGEDKARRMLIKLVTPWHTPS